MLYADSSYKYKAEKGFRTILFPKLSWFNKLLLKIKGYNVVKLPERPEDN